MSKLFDKFGGLRVEVLWADLKPLIDGTTAKFPFLEATDEGGKTTVMAFDGQAGYFTTLANPTEEGEFTTAKASAIAYFNQTPTVYPDDSDFRLGVNALTRSGAKGTSVAADITSTPYDANTEALHVDIIDSAASRLASKLIVAGYHAAALGGTTYILMIDLSDGDGGDYKHVGSSSIKLTTVTGSLVKSSIGSQWRSIVGIIMAIDATEATIHWLDAATLFALDTSTVEQHKATIVPSVLDLEVSGGAMVNSSGGYDEAGVTAVNTTGTLNNVVGNAKTPAVGDMVLRVTQNSGGGTAETAYSVRYLVD
jgi:hypothetical protein